jgi:uncharacterized protein
VNAFALLLVSALAIPAPQELQIPASRGHLSDFAGVVDPQRGARIERIAEYVRAQSRGEIAIVTLRDIGGREVNDIALRIGRQWGVGANAAVGDRARNAGVVILLVPKETASDGRGQIAVEVGQGAEGFLPDGVAGDIHRASRPQLVAGDYGAALEAITYRVAERFANEFGFSMDSLAAFAPARPVQQPRQGRESGRIIGIIVMFMVVAILGSLFGGGPRGRGRRGWSGGGGGLGSALPWIILSQLGNRGGGGRGWGGGWGGGGGGGGGFGGFGGGGGFSGGGSHGSW